MTAERWRIGLLSTLLLLFLLTSLPDSEAAENQAARSEAQLRQLQGEIDKLRANLSDSGTQRERLLVELKESEQQIGLSARRLHLIGEQLQKQQSKLDQLEDAFTREQAALQEDQKALQRQVRAAYAMGRQQRLKILLNQQDPAIVSRVMVYYDYFNRTRIARIERIRRSMESLHQQQEQIGNERRAQLELQSRELAEQELQKINLLQRTAVVENLNLEMRDNSDRLAGLIKDQEQLQGLLNQLQTEHATKSLEQTQTQPISELKGKLRWPVTGRVTSAFGSRGEGELKRDGVIITAPLGYEVRAIHRGRVAFADWLRGFGLLLIIDHGGGYMSLYGHNQSLFRETGEWVEAGEPVALVGNSGGRSEYGVYFGIRIDGNPVNPKGWCRRLEPGNRVSWQFLLNGELENLSNRFGFSIEDVELPLGDTPPSPAVSMVWKGIVAGNG